MLAVGAEDAHTTEAIFVEGAPIAVRHHVTNTFTRSAATQGKYGVVLSVGVVLLRVKEHCIRGRSIRTSRQLVRARARMCPRAGCCTVSSRALSLFQAETVHTEHSVYEAIPSMSSTASDRQSRDTSSSVKQVQGGALCAGSLAPACSSDNLAHC